MTTLLGCAIVLLLLLLLGVSTGTVRHLQRENTRLRTQRNLLRSRVNAAAAIATWPGPRPPAPAAPVAGTTPPPLPRRHPLPAPHAARASDAQVLAEFQRIIAANHPED